MREDGFYWVTQKGWRPDVPPQVAEWTNGLGWGFVGTWQIPNESDVTVHGERLIQPAVKIS